MPQKIKLERLKNELTIWDVAYLTDLPPYNKDGTYNSPFRKDCHPSFSIYNNGRLFRDFATNERGDIVDFFKRAKNCRFSEAVKGLETVFREKRKETVQSPISTYARKNESPLRIPALEWKETYAQILSTMRGFENGALKTAYERGTFGFCQYKGHVSWIVTDSADICAQARRLDALPFGCGENLHKAETLKGSTCAYPIGLSAAEGYRNIALCEGSTDFLAAYHFMVVYDAVDTIAPVAMLGATHRIGSEYIRHFEGKNVLIFPDDDKAGEMALNNWGRQLEDVAEVCYFDFSQFKKSDGTPVKDLCDFIYLDPRQQKEAGAYANPFNEISKERPSSGN